MSYPGFVPISSLPPVPKFGESAEEILLKYYDSKSPTDTIGFPWSPNSREVIAYFGVYARISGECANCGNQIHKTFGCKKCRTPGIRR